MAKLAVITDATLAVGFSLAGVEVHAMSSPEEAKRVLLRLMSEADMGVIAINSGYLNALDEMTRRRVGESTKPVIVGLPSGMPTVPEERRSRQIAELIRRAIGFRITFPEG